MMGRIVQRYDKRRRPAMSAVEMAIIAPLLLLLLFGIIEFGWYMMARQMVHHAASEIVRLAVLPGYEDQNGSGAFDQELKAQAAAILAPLNLVEADISLARDPAQSAADPCEVVTVTVPLSKVKLPGFVLDLLLGDPGADDGYAPITFTVTRAHPDFAGVPDDNGNMIICGGG